MTASNTPISTYGTQVPYNESIRDKEMQSIQHHNQSSKIKRSVILGMLYMINNMADVAQILHAIDVARTHMSKIDLCIIITKSAALFGFICMAIGFVKIIIGNYQPVLLEGLDAAVQILNYPNHCIAKLSTISIRQPSTNWWTRLCNIMNNIDSDATLHDVIHRCNDIGRNITLGFAIISTNMRSMQDGFESRMGRMEDRMNGIEQRMDGIEQRMGRMEIMLGKIMTHLNIPMED